MHYAKELDRRLLESKRELTTEVESLVQMLRGVSITTEQEKQIEEVIAKLVNLIKVVNDLAELKYSQGATEK